MATLATETLTLPILGMTCASCQHHVEEALNATPGVESAHVDLIAQRASVVFDPSLTGIRLRCRAAPYGRACCGRGSERFAIHFKG
jgi:copper chaperone CopZ